MSDRWYKKGDALLSDIEDSKTGKGVILWFLGQMGFVIKINEIIFYIDALLNDFSDDKGNGRIYPPPFYTKNKKTGADSRGVKAHFFLSTHDHGDHLNLETLLPLAKANEKTEFVVPEPSREVLIKAGIEENRIVGARIDRVITIIPPLEDRSSLLEDMSIGCIGAAHPVYEKINDCFTCLGYIIQGNGITIYHAGDTMVTKELIEDLKVYQPIDIAILPINGADWERTSKGIIGNMDTQDAVKLCRELDIDLVIPGHFDMMNNNSVNPAHFVDVMYKLCPNKKFHIFALGEKFYYQR